MQFCTAVALATVFLLSSCPKLQAAVVGPVSGDTAAPHPCQMCCQAAAGVPGVPGIPGTPGPYGLQGDLGPRGPLGPQGQKGELGEIGVMGEPGSPGSKGPKGDAGIGLPGKVGPRGPPGVSGQTGETGVKGQKGDLGPKGEVGPLGRKGDNGQIGVLGEPGLPGNPGPKGDTGIGLPGNVGPSGSPGLPGTTGESGVKGQKGEPGEIQGVHSRVAFTMVRRSEFFSTDVTRLPFEKTVTLLPGTDIDLATGTFTCHVPGTYVFMFSVYKHSSTSTFYIRLRKSGDIVVTAGSVGSSSKEQVAGSALLVLQQGDLVYLMMNGRLADSYHQFNSFSGFLLYEE